MAATQTSASVESQVKETKQEQAKQGKTGHGEIPFMRFMVIGSSLGLLSLFLIRLWQGAWWFPVGLDATTPEFATYWLGLLYLEWVVLIAVGMIGYLAYRKPCTICTAYKKELGRIDPEHELNHIGKLWATVAVAAIFGFGVSYLLSRTPPGTKSWCETPPLHPAIFRSSFMPFRCCLS